MTQSLLNSFSPDSPLMFGLYGAVFAFVVALAAFYMVASIRRAKKLGLSAEKIKKVISSSLSFSILPAIGIALGIITLAGSLGVAFPSIRLSVIGSLQYETQMADGAATALAGSLQGLMSRGMTAKDLVTISTVMTVSIMSGPILVLVFYRRLQPKFGTLMGKNAGVGKNSVNLGELIFQVCFIGLVLGYLAMSITSVATGAGYVDSYFNFIAVIVAMLMMYICDLLITKLKWQWLDSFATPVSMLIAMATVAVISYFATKNGWPLASVEAAASAMLV